jgi:phospholipase C
MIGLGALAALGLGASVGINGCSNSNNNSARTADNNVGSVGLALSLGGGLELDSVNYTVNGPSGFTKTGSFDVSHSSTVSGVIGGLPAGMGYSITVTGTTTDGSTTCLGSGTFSVVAGQTAMVTVAIDCHQAARTGSVLVNGTINVCPTIDGVSASPAEVFIGHSLSVAVTAHDSDAGPSALSYHWAAGTGSFGDPTLASTTFTCAVPGPVTLTVTVSDGDASPGCPAQLAVQVTCSQPALSQMGHLVVIYLENWSFDSLYGSFPGAEGLSAPTAHVPQIDNTTGLPFVTLPQVDPNIPLGLPNASFDIGQFVPANQLIHDLVHRFYQEQSQIDGGRMDKFVTISDAKGLSLGYYQTSILPMYQLIQSMPGQATVLDHFFHAAFGGSFLNHQWLIAAQTPVFPNAPASITAVLDASGNLVTDGQVTPDGFVVNTSFTVNSPHPATTPVANLVPNQTNVTIGDRLSAAGIDWAWYSGGWNDALAGHPDPLFQFHHQPFAFYTNFADGTAAKAQHLKDETDFSAAVAAGRLPPVSFVKPIGANNEHPGYATLLAGENHTVGLVQSIVNSPLWNDTTIIVTYDEHGGFFDHVPPPVVDRWGPGSRIPAIVFSKYATGGVDKTPYDTTAILNLIEKRWNVAALSPRDAAQNDLSTHALIFAPSGGGTGTGGASGSGGATGAGGATATGAGGATGSGGATGAGTGGATGSAPTTAQVQAILNTNCTVCHSGTAPPQGLDWTNVRAQIGVPANECTGKMRINSGHSNVSYVIDKIMGAAQDGGCFSGARMPRGAAALSATDIATFASWIDAGTPL